MAALTKQAIRGRIATQLDALAGWAESVQNPDLFGQDPRGLSHQLFAISHRRAHPLDDRQKAANGTYQRIDWSIQWSMRIRGDAALADYDLALAGEQDLIQQLAATSLANLHLRLEDQTTDASSGEWMIGRVEISTRTLYALA